MKAWFKEFVRSMRADEPMWFDTWTPERQAEYKETRRLMHEAMLRFPMF